LSTKPNLIGKCLEWPKGSNSMFFEESTIEASK
jgi:hypothetical protein